MVTTAVAVTFCGRNHGGTADVDARANASGASRASARIDTESLSRVSDPTADSAAQRFDAFLRYSRFIIPRDAAALDTLIACQLEGSVSHAKAMATYRVLGVHRRPANADTVDASAEVVSVAQVNDHDAYVQKVSTDTIHWTMTRDTLTHHWGICDPAGRSGDFLGAGPLYGKATWLPAGASWRTALKLADSIRAAR